MILHHSELKKRENAFVIVRFSVRNISTSTWIITSNFPKIFIYVIAGNNIDYQIEMYTKRQEDEVVIKQTKLYSKHIPAVL